MLKGDAAGALDDGRLYLKTAPKERPGYAEIQRSVEELERRLPK
jgi:hypothetical protein